MPTVLEEKKEVIWTPSTPRGHAKPGPRVATEAEMKRNVLRKGVPVTDEVKKKMGQKRRGQYKPQSEETKAKRRATMLARKDEFDAKKKVTIAARQAEKKRLEEEYYAAQEIEAANTKKEED